MNNFIFVAIGGIVLVGAIFFLMSMGDDNKMTNNPVATTTIEQRAATTPQNQQQEEGVMVGGEMMLPSRNLVENAMNASNLTTVVAAIEAADLVDTLEGEGPFTVFAPTNAAFNKLASGTVATLLMEENQADLQDILGYHVVSGTYTAAQLTDGLTLETVQGEELTFTRTNGVLMINGEVMIETADVRASNGIAHVINTVLTPPTE